MDIGVTGGQYSVHNFCKECGFGRIRKGQIMFPGAKINELENFRKGIKENNDKD